MGVEKEIIEHGFNWVAFILAIIFFLISSRPSIIKQTENDGKSKITIYIFCFFLSTVIYFLIDSMK